MEMRFDESRGLIYIDDTAIHLDLLRRMADPDKRVLWRFSVEDGLIVARCYTEDQVIWTGERKPMDIVVGVKG